MSSPHHRPIHLSEAQIDWMVEIISSIVRNNLLQEPPADWRQIPDWWFDLKKRKQLRAAPPELLDDVMMASSCLEAFRR